MPQIDLSAGTIDYIDTGGPGPVVVPVHGVVMDATVWTDVIAEMRHDHRLVAPTLPLGAHRTPMNDDADLSLPGQARLLAEFIERLDLSDVTLVVNDWGGPQLTAVEHPERIARLVLTPCEAFDNIPPGLPGKFAGFAARMPGGLMLAAQALRFRPMRRLPTTFGWMSKRPVRREIFDPWVVPLRTQRVVRRDVAKYVRTTDMTVLLDVAERLKSFERPVLVAWAADDKVMPREHGPRLAALVPQGHFVEVADCRVLMPLDQPSVLAADIRRFIADHPDGVDDGGHEHLRVDLER